MISSKTLLHLVSRCPLLKSFTLVIDEDDMLGNDRSSIIDLIECMPVIERLFIDGFLSHCFSIDSLPQEHPVSLVHLKYLHIENMCFLDSRELPLLFLLIRCSPNLEKLFLILDLPEGATTYPAALEIYEKDPITLKKYSKIWLKNLKKLTICQFLDTKLHLEFVQLILAKSPMLSKVKIWSGGKMVPGSNTRRILQHSPRASGAAKILVD
ncbi:F-box/FBD/LRR-repeat protein At1g13570-like [Rutidosis leptorrhynchoides]|uniref:F-box/FBD/LRR-repeat protein At1g13570-like n=1 Tax=Rutidosis leptorrhynchoides TaxID=125765 RepID=UPI003A99BBE5